MANQKIIDKKQEIVNEITQKIKDSNSFVLFYHTGLNVADETELRRKLKEANSEFKIYKNTLMKRALDSLNINFDGFLEGPNAAAFSSDAIAPIKVLADFAKEHSEIEFRIGLVDGEISDVDKLKQLSTIPSREGLLTMLAGGMIGIVKDLSICLNMYADKLESQEN